MRTTKHGFGSLRSAGVFFASFIFLAVFPTLTAGAIRFWFALARLEPRWPEMGNHSKRLPGGTATRQGQSRGGPRLQVQVFGTCVRCGANRAGHCRPSNGKNAGER